MTIYVHDLTGVEISGFHIQRVQEKHPATTKDTPIAVIQSIDRRIELIVAANGSQKKLVRLQVMLRDRANAELSLPRTRFEDAMLRSIRQMEEFLFLQAVG